LLDAIRGGNLPTLIHEARVQQRVVNLQRAMNNAAQKRNAVPIVGDRRKSVLYQDLRSGSRSIVAFFHRWPQQRLDRPTILNSLARFMLRSLDAGSA
jgi:hypothetical protein